jgi:hypothetical protein
MCLGLNFKKEDEREPVFLLFFHIQARLSEGHKELKKFGEEEERG